MKKLLSAAFLLFSIPVFGQVKNDSLSTKLNRKFSIGINISPDYSYRTLTKNDKSLSDSIWKYAKNLEDSIEIAKFGYTVGINFCYQLTKRVSAEIGIHYSNKGYKTIPIETISVDHAGNIFTTKAVNISNFIYLDVPVKVNFTFFNRHVQLIAGAGLTVNLFLKSTFQSIPDDKNNPGIFVTGDYPYKRLNISPTISVGLKYNLNERMAFRLEPTYRYGILNLDDTSYKSVHLWGYGLTLGYYYNL